MFNDEFDPYAVLEHLSNQNLQHAENMVKLSDFMLSLSQQTDTQHRQLDALFTMIRSQNTLINILTERVKALESTEQENINNNSL